jgi:DNA-binding response OmpR family regulator
LLVDDDAVQLRTSQRVLARAGFQVDTASSPEAAYLLLGSRAGSQERPYEALIADLRLGREEDGLSLCERARSLVPLLPTLLTSGQALDQRVEMAIASGIAWLAKPFTADELTSTLQRLLLAPPAVLAAPVADQQSPTRGAG